MATNSAVPANNAAAPGPFQLDQKLVAAGILNLKKDAFVYADADASSEFVVNLNRQEASTVIVRKPSGVTFENTPQDRPAILGYTSVTPSPFVEVTLTGDKYAKVPVDRLGVKPTEYASILAEDFGTGLVKVLNSNFLGDISENGVKTAGGAIDPTTSAAVWSGLVHTVAEIADNDIDVSELTLYVSNKMWTPLILNEGVLSTTNDPRSTAVNLLGVGKVRTVALPDGVGAVAFHRRAVTQAQVLDRIRVIQHDADDAVFTRAVFGTKILENDAVRVLATETE